MSKIHLLYEFWFLFDLKSRIEIQAFHPQGVQPQISPDQLTLSQPGGADYAHHITTGTPGFSDLSMALKLMDIIE